MNEAELRHRWRCLEITTRHQNQNIDAKMEDFIRDEKNGIHILYTHNRHVISNLIPGVAAEAMLWSLDNSPEGSEYQIPDWKKLEDASPDESWQPSAPLMIYQPTRADMLAALTLYSNFAIKTQ